MQSSLRESHIQRGRGLKPPCCALNSLRSGSTQQGDIFHVRFFAKQKISHRIYPRPRYISLNSLPNGFIINWVWWVCISSLIHWFSPSKAIGPPKLNSIEEGVAVAIESQTLSLNQVDSGLLEASSPPPRINLRMIVDLRIYWKLMVWKFPKTLKTYKGVKP